MGYSRWSDAAYESVRAPRTQLSSEEIFRGTRTIDPLMDPTALGVGGVRESRDSEHHPASVPIIVAFDVTASMGDIPTRFAQEHLGSLMRMLVEQGDVSDPQVLFAAVGDALVDQAPLQVGQFESGLEMDMWLTRLWLEGGGGDAPESYLLSHWFAANHTAADCWEKRGRKGYLFSIGDAANKPLSPAQVQRVFGYAPDGPVDNAAIVAAASERWELFHLLVTRGRRVKGGVRRSWRRLMGDRMLLLDQTEAICTVIASLVGLSEGRLTAESARSRLLAAGVRPDQAGAMISAPTTHLPEG